MSALRVSRPGQQPVLVDLGPGSASTGILHGTFAVPVDTCFHDWRELVDPCGKEARRRARMADPAYAEHRRQQHRQACARYRARKAAA